MHVGCERAVDWRSMWPIRSSLALVLAGVWVGCLGGDPVEDFRVARATGTPEGYVAFLERHPRNPLAGSARKELQALHEKIDWATAEQAGSPEGYQRFIAAHPRHYFAAAARERRDRLVEQNDWRHAREVDHVEGYSAFIRKYPASDFASKAGARIERVGRSEHVAHVLEISAQLARDTGEPVLPVFAFVPSSGPLYAVIKEPDHSYRKVTARPADGAQNPHLTGIDAPALHFAPARSGIVIYLNWELVASARFDRELRRLFAHCVAAVDPTQTGSRMLVFASPDAPPRRFDDRGSAATWFGGSQHFRNGLTESDWTRRARAAQALGLLGDVGSVYALAAVWRDERVEVRNATAVALLRLKSDTASALARERAAERPEPLIAALSHWDPAIASDADAMLVSIGSAAVPALIAELDRPLSPAAPAVARVLGEIGDWRAVDALVRRLGDATHTRDAADRALSQIGTQPAAARQRAREPIDTME